MADIIQNNWPAVLDVDTSVLQEDRACDEWDEDSCCNYSSDGSKVIDAENFPSEVSIREGARILCDGLFSFQDYMYDEDLAPGEEVPEDARVSYLDKISLPASITHIGREVFRECGALKHIRLPKNLQVIGDSAFENCWSLESIACPASLLYIGDYAFGECFSLENVRLNRNLRAIGPYAFFYCENLEEIHLPAALEFIGEDAFRCCKSLKRIFVPAGTKTRFASMLPASLAKKLREE